VHDSRNALESPFLTVVVRTQGTRNSIIGDAFLCLAAQTDRSFEVLVVGHDMAETQRAQFLRTVDQYAPLLPEIRVHQHVGGHRGAPLNTALSQTRTDYVAFLDDDDAVWPHWVETFRVLAAQAPDTILRSTVVAQAITPAPWGGGSDGFVSCGKLAMPFPRDFNLIDHLYVNRTPFMGLAFPRTYFERPEAAFDESLLVVEDWDFLLRGSLACRVTTSPSVTALYRQWRGGQNSMSHGTEELWNESMRRVHEKLDSDQMCLPPGSIKELVHLHESLIESRQNEKRLKSQLAGKRKEMRTLKPRRRLAPRLSSFAHKVLARRTK
jgi:glycosyltransferase involved in cell wall biosynthesis